eukprot:1083676-Pelagomonas_calceolata.AAC.1
MLAGLKAKERRDKVASLHPPGPDLAQECSIHKNWKARKEKGNYKVYKDKKKGSLLLSWFKKAKEGKEAVYAEETLLTSYRKKEASKTHDVGNAQRLGYKVTMGFDLQPGSLATRPAQGLQGLQGWLAYSPRIWLIGC